MLIFSSQLENHLPSQSHIQLNRKLKLKGVKLSQEINLSKKFPFTLGSTTLSSILYYTNKLLKLLKIFYMKPVNSVDVRQTRMKVWPGYRNPVFS